MTLKLQRIATRIRPVNPPALRISGIPKPIAAYRALGAAASRPYSSETPKEDDDEPKSLPKKASKLVNTILHGSEQARQELNDTFSKVLARGKYLHELATHRIKPDRVEEYSAILSDYYPRIVKELSPSTKLVGSWITHIGEQDTAVHIWEYDSYSAFSEAQGHIASSKEFQQLQKQIAPLLRKRENQIMLEFGFWTTSSPVTTGGIYELRSYTLLPGRLLEWEQNWRRGVECRKNNEQLMGAWFSQLGDLNQVHHLWAHKDLQTRKETREKAWKEDGWAKTVYNTVRVVQNMKSQILVPLPFSSLK
ncbi:hypothetical protein H4219_000208 [Mycoemilia scoparia]|uniref:NIPSNAP domain-containing protein n=1 Tax=Mycoemilia scoparia TaxID=417184 RepID=A0A9W8DXU1_9FUNG|nr:hypothetical protein H4219_000208 [Mycoemilia scoparia]